MQLLNQDEQWVLSCEQQTDPIIENTMYNASSKPAILEFLSAKINACTFFRYYGKQGVSFYRVNRYKCLANQRTINITPCMANGGSSTNVRSRDDVGCVYQ